ncbi:MULTISPECIES: GNAT family N-acetyltransferase [Bacillus]|uniref:GNAT family N-acetyltransferase n=1 Tax=Bacillus TaxID=1386 RepID=UPI000618713C|nr:MULTISPECIES: GNAT family N-acetyltransferase [Bacillus]KKC57513.1 acetyltransferase, GNAT family [Bacillus sp. UMTAT18]MCC2372648.1 GNAT family N-acetyltransferase [Bacillus paranthracis]MDA1526852.1 GNAT family N-acetyltransferase [Bacillus cereus group sp. TH260-2LC]MDR4165707.1 GNAT family N-acetyltransferase [Bacillus paranthracis]MDU2389950.1 GNAT family N-acetyltransferase [Bacillus sp. (in: firmicutes)]
MFPILKTERLILRELTEEDAPGILQCFSNTDVLRYYGQKPLQDIDQVKQIIHNFKLSYNARSGIKWGIELKDKKELIGTIGFHDWSSEHKRANISYAFLPEHWGQGYATEAVSEVISYGFHTIHLKRIGAIVFLENEASNKVLLKLGFEKEGVLKNYMYQDDIPYDTNFYSLLKSF